MQLRSLTTMKIGGEPELFLRLQDLKELDKPLPSPVRILGNGSNVLIDDQPLQGTVICVRDFPPSEPTILSEDSKSCVIQVSAGMFLPSLCRWAEKRGLSGVEYMIGVPGTLGGAVVQNAGANEQEISVVLRSATLFDLKSHQTIEVSNQDLKFSYRHSFLKDRDDLLVVSAKLELSKERPLAQIQERIAMNQTYRREKTPYSKPSLGSVFTRLPDGKGGWLYPGKLIEEAGLKGLQKGGARVSDVHANYIVNEGQATFDDVMSLIATIEKIIFEKFGVRMNREILIWSDRT